MDLESKKTRLIGSKVREERNFDIPLFPLACEKKA